MLLNFPKNEKTLKHHPEKKITPAFFDAFLYFRHLKPIRLSGYDSPHDSPIGSLIGRAVHDIYLWIKIKAKNVIPFLHGNGTCPAMVEGCFGGPQDAEGKAETTI